MNHSWLALSRLASFLIIVLPVRAAIRRRRFGSTGSPDGQKRRPFAVIRNPSYVAMLAAAAGSVLIAPSLVACAGWVLTLASLMFTTRIEESLLVGRYGDPYRRYTAQVGRFLPGVGERSRLQQV